MLLAFKYNIVCRVINWNPEKLQDVVAWDLGQNKTTKSYTGIPENRLFRRYSKTSHLFSFTYFRGGFFVFGDVTYKYFWR